MTNDPPARPARRSDAARTGNRGGAAQLDPLGNNVAEIAQLEREGLDGRSTGEKLSDAITRRAGTMAFVALHLVFYAAWFGVNAGLVPGVPVFDPFPFGTLTLMVSAEGVFLALFILITQNRISRLTERRAHLDPQVSLLAEQELTLLLQMQRRMCERLGIAVEDAHEHVESLSQRTEVRRLIEELEENLPDE